MDFGLLGGTGAKQETPHADGNMFRLNVFRHAEWLPS